VEKLHGDRPKQIETGSDTDHGETGCCRLKGQKAQVLGSCFIAQALKTRRWGVAFGGASVSCISMSLALKITIITLLVVSLGCGYEPDVAVTSLISLVKQP